MYIRVNVKSGARQNLVTKINALEYRVNVKERAINGKANKVVIRVLAKYFNVPKTNVQITKGTLCSFKVIFIDK